MRLRVFQSEKGDCILVSTTSGQRTHHMLADGGMGAAYTEFVAPFLNRMHQNGEELGLVYVSHIDADHIEGVLQMLDDLVEWRVFEHHGAGSGMNPPGSLRPPEIRGIWHNAFHEQIGRNRGAIERQLAASERSLSFFLDGSHGVEQEAIARSLADLGTSRRQAVLVSRRISDGQLGIPLNEDFGGRLALVSDPSEPDIRLGGMRITVIGPFDDELRKLRNDWQEWLRSQSGKRQLRTIRRDSRVDEQRLLGSSAEELLVPWEIDAADQMTIEQANAARFHPPSGLAAAGRLGRRSRVSTPNLASLMLLLEENGHSVLMTGDGHSDDILDGLHTMNKLDANGDIHVDVLKVQHHGSEHNLDAPFCQRVIADTYLFCGNGEHHNPDLDVIDAIVEARLPGSKRSAHANAGDRFRLCFNASARVRDPGDQAHMRKVEQKVRGWRQRSQGQMLAPVFLRGASFTVDVR